MERRDTLFAFCVSAVVAGYGSPACGEGPVLDGILTNSAPGMFAARADPRPPDQRNTPNPTREGERPREPQGNSHDGQ